MKRFRFRLDRVLQLRENAEDEAARAVAAARSDAEAAAAEASAAERALLHAVAQASEMAQATTAGVLAVMRFSLENARTRTRLAAEARLQAEQQLERALAAWQVARADRQALDKLKTQRHEAWVADANRAEQADIDDVALRSAAAREERR